MTEIECTTSVRMQTQSPAAAAEVEAAATESVSRFDQKDFSFLSFSLSLSFCQRLPSILPLVLLCSLLRLTFKTDARLGCKNKLHAASPSLPPLASPSPSPLFPLRPSLSLLSAPLEWQSLCTGTLAAIDSDSPSRRFGAKRRESLDEMRIVGANSLARLACIFPAPVAGPETQAESRF